MEAIPIFHIHENPGMLHHILKEIDLQITDAYCLIAGNLCHVNENIVHSCTMQSQFVINLLQKASDMDRFFGTI
jgi:hypothetical protein